MIINFLAAADSTPLTKTFSQNFGVLTKSAYPNVRNFNSIELEANTIDQFYATIVVNAEANNCLIKGRLQKELNNESRQGSTNPLSMTKWIVFDIDHLPGINTPEDFIALLPSAFHNSSYILQYSSSHGFDTSNTLRAHVFFMLAEEASPQLLKVWMKAFNLDTPQLAEHLRLAEGGCTLKWPLDISVNQNDKLIYIAPPLCINLEDPLPVTERITLVRKAHDAVLVDFNANAESVRTAEINKINALRTDLGLERKRMKIKMVDGYSVITNADQMTLVGQPFEERGFVYLPIGSNKYTFYHPIGNHEFLYSFKDPDIAFPMEAVLPSYYWHCERQKQQENQSTDTIFTFRDQRADVKYIGSYTADLTRVRVDKVKAREDIEDFFTQHGQRKPELIESWMYEFDPTTTVRIRPEKRWINKFIPTPYMMLDPSEHATMPEKIKLLLLHIMAYDEECYEHFINWLAYKLQTREKCKTAWFFQGVEGTGKGVLFNMVLAPLFGSECCHLKRMDNLLDKFNADLETALFWVIDEANIENFKDDGQILEKLKNLIVEDTQVIRAMHTNQYSAVNYTDVLLFSNQSLAIRISATDRRYNVAPRQNQPLLRVMDRDTIKDLKKDLPQLATYLMSYEVDVNKVQEPLDNQAKRDMITLSRNTHDEFIHNLMTGQLIYLLRSIGEQPEISKMVSFLGTKEILTRIAQNPSAPHNCNLRIDEISKLYSYIVGNGKQVPVAKMLRMLMLRGADIDVHNDEALSTLRVNWVINETAMQRWLIQSNQSSRSPHGQQSSASAD